MDYTTISSIKFIAVLDTNVIYPVKVRDLIFTMADMHAFTIKWSKNIFKEWEAVMKKKGMEEKIIQRQLNNASLAFPDALVENYEHIMEILNLPDPDDRHVMAAAIKTNANVIVTNNVKDFPLEYLKSFNLDVKTPDEFLCDAVDLNLKAAMQAFKNMVAKYKNPPMDEMEVLVDLRKKYFPKTMAYLYSQMPIT